MGIVLDLGNGFLCKTLDLKFSELFLLINDKKNP